MFIKYLDFLSPPTTFYYNGSLSHSSIISGIISIISISITIILAVYSSIRLIKREDPNAFYFNTYVQDAGIFPLNASSLFHFIAIADLSNGYMINGFDFSNFRIVGYETFLETYFDNNNLSAYDHWLYGFCDNESDTKGISYLTNYSFFEKSACIRYYFNFADQKYYSTKDEKFRWPRIAHGTLNDNLKLYSIIIEKCHEETLNLILGEEHHCKNDSEINKLFNSVRIVNFYFINNYINILQYEKPNTKFFYRIETGIYQNQYSINHLNFNPSKIKTHKGLILDNIVEEDSYIFDRNDEFVKDNFGKEIYVGYSFWLKNSLNFYERSYKKVQDILSFIGGIKQIITILAFYINKFYYNYIVLFDTEKLLTSSIHEEKKIHNKKKFKYGKIKNIKKEELKNIKKEEIKEKKHHKSFDRNKNTGNINIKSNKGKNEENPSKIGSNNFLTNYESKDGKINFKMKKNEHNKDSENLIEDTINKNNIFCSYISFKFLCKKSSGFFYTYNKFRERIISEEHLIRNHLNIYNLIKITYKKRNFRRNSYQLNNLVKLA